MLITPVKSKINDLAIFGGPCALAKELHVGLPNIGNRQRLFRRINEILDGRRLTNNGPQVLEFEKRVATYLKTRHCLTVSSGSVGLQVAAKAMELQGEVIVPSFTFVGTVHALSWLGLTPVFCDIDPDTHCIDARDVERLITDRTTAILGVHLWGRPCDVESLSSIAKRAGLKLLFDAAHAFGCSHRGKMIGNFGLAEIFSFHATKLLNTFEGGAIATNDDDLAARLRLMRNHGFVAEDSVIELGTNAKMTEISAAMGLTCLDSLDEFIATNFDRYSRYKEGLATLPGIRVLKYNERERSNYQYVVLEVDEGTAGISRDALQEVLRAERILARRYFYPGCHRVEPYRSFSLLPNPSPALARTEMLASRVLCLPTGPQLNVGEVNRIVDIIRFVITNGCEISRRLQPVCL